MATRIDTILVTTFSRTLWEQYAEVCIRSWAEHLPENIAVWIYDEDNVIKLMGPLYEEWPASWLILSPTVSQPYVEFMKKHPQTPKHKDWRQDVRRFAHKIFAFAEASYWRRADYLIWMDADVFCFADVPADFFSTLLTETNLFYLGRKEYSHSECGCWGIACNDATIAFVQAFQELYVSGAVTELDQQHDSYVFDWLRKRWERSMGLQANSISHAPKGHVWLASPLAQYFDHWKGQRWRTQKSWKEDETSLTAQGVRLQLNHEYWRHLPSRYGVRRT